MQVRSMILQAQLIASNKVILLFYRAFERDKYVRHDRYLQRLVRPLYNLTHHRQNLLAWDNGYWLDPLWKMFSSKKIPASSVPFFSEECGEKFRDIANCEPALSAFLNRLSNFRPRKYLIDNLNMMNSAKIYCDQYFSISESFVA
jgi:hypothetical protein